MYMYICIYTYIYIYVYIDIYYIYSYGVGGWFRLYLGFGGGGLVFTFMVLMWDSEAWGFLRVSELYSHGPLFNPKGPRYLYGRM